jgi:hypothetical protein
MLLVLNGNTEDVIFLALHIRVQIKSLAPPLAVTTKQKSDLDMQGNHFKTPSRTSTEK